VEVKKLKFPATIRLAKSTHGSIVQGPHVNSDRKTVFFYHDGVLKKKQGPPMVSGELEISTQWAGTPITVYNVGRGIACISYGNNPYPSVITLKPATCDQCKTGHLSRLRLDCFTPRRPMSARGDEECRCV
jgi:hypothetical protein